MESVRVDVGSYATACEKSPHKTQIDQWLNEGKSYNWISQQLKANGERISDKSIGKYAKKRKERVQEALMQDPNYQKQVAVMNQQLTDGVSQLQPVDVMKQINDMIDHSAEMLGKARQENIQINNVKDMRMVQQTMLEAIKTYGEIVVQAQKFEKIEENPDLLRPQMNVEVKDVLIDMLGGNGEDTSIIDALRSRLGNG